MKTQELLKEFENKFKKIKAELKFEATLEDLDRIFFIKDAVLKDGFVSEKVTRQICYRIIETYVGWNDYLHSLIMPNPQNMFNLGESKIFSQEEKKEIIETMKKVMELSSRHSIIGLTKNPKEEAKFIDESINFWDTEFKVRLIDIMKKVNKEWGKIE